MVVVEKKKKIRDTSLWLLHGIEEILAIPNFYYHLKSDCNSAEQEIEEVEKEFNEVSSQIFSLLADLKYCSKLGGLVRGIKSVFSNVNRYPGKITIQRLEEGGIFELKDLVDKDVSDLVNIGVQRNYAELIIDYVNRRRT